jgi:hypothetical protein
MKKILCISILVLFAVLFSSSVMATDPVVTGVLPEDLAVVDPNPLLSVIVTSTGNTTVYFLWNNDGTWEALGNETTSPTGVGYDEDVVQFQTDWATWEADYQWSANVSDTAGWTNVTGNLTIRAATVSEVTVPIVTEFAGVFIFLILAVGILNALGHSIGKL